MKLLPSGNSRVLFLAGGCRIDAKDLLCVDKATFAKGAWLTNFVEANSDGMAISTNLVCLPKSNCNP